MQSAVLATAAVTSLMMSLTGLTMGIIMVVYAMGLPIEVAVWSLAVFPASLALIVGKNGFRIRNVLYLSVIANFFWPAFFCSLLITKASVKELFNFFKGIGIASPPQLFALFILWAAAVASIFFVIRKLERL